MAQVSGRGEQPSRTVFEDGSQFFFHAQGSRHFEAEDMLLVHINGALSEHVLVFFTLKNNGALWLPKLQLGFSFNDGLPLQKRNTAVF